MLLSLSLSIVFNERQNLGSKKYNVHNVPLLFAHDTNELSQKTQPTSNLMGSIIKYLFANLAAGLGN